MSETISADGVSASSLKLLDETVLVRPAPVEETRASGLVVPNTPSQNFLGDAFCGTVVAVGPGKLVEQGPSPGELAAFVEESIRTAYVTCRPNGQATLGLFSSRVAADVAAFMEKRKPGRRVPTPWSPGDHVYVRQGFGPEVLLREGRHHLVSRGNAHHGHGIVAAWDPGHVHCWHFDHHDKIDYAFCACGSNSYLGEGRTMDTRLPACSACPAGERLAEAVLGGKVCDMRIPEAAPANPYEMRPVDDGRHDV